MIEVLSPLSLEVCEGDGISCWELMLNTDRDFDQGIPFTAMLAEIVEALGDDAHLTLGEDDLCVNGELVWRGRAIKVYFEYLLGYLTLTSNDRAVMDEVLERLLPIVSVIQQA